ncbi:alpha/beta hydrolase family protein [Hyphococcus luteus]|uniref:Peptidase S9 prolyl oligopeptidase catalytic domain-containing protein n=1 Tax=Hyphococcus luteus TaxID=2058213 RepID=A0A2S7K6U0_9PROT|nr:prolyl oligopeptidase family serine peptidase [Marinicaulis flavus]PQA88223.1 hypothetical protein CW354_07915 [Marinicaulis flavus]
MKTLFAVAAACAAMLSPAFSQSVLKSRETMTLPGYAQALETSDVDVYADEGTYEAARNDSAYIFEKLTYESDGFEVVAYLMRARNGGARAGVVFNRGSYIRNNAAPELLPLMHRMAREGFTVLAPMYRGSEGAEGRDEMGGADLDDLMATAALAGELDSIIDDALYLYGESRGAMMVYQAIRDGYPARAAAVYGGFTDLERLIDSDPERYAGLTQALWPDFDENREAIIARRSALRFADALKTPLLIMHGGRDDDIPLAHALDMAAALAARGRDFDLVVYGDDSHVLPGHAEARDGRAARWFRAH